MAWKDVLQTKKTVFDVAKSKINQGKKGEKMERYTIPEVNTDNEWLYLTGQQPRALMRHTFTPIKPKQILLVDVYSSWSGPCSAMESYLRRMRLSFVETPDCLALAKACCDDIEDLEPFRSDPRPTFLFWARGKAVALLRGANRPLLTQLIEQEVATEVNEAPREQVDIDFRSHRVIQCQGELAKLDEDEVVHSIGTGSTDMLTSFFQDSPIMTKKPISKKKSDDDLEEVTEKRTSEEKQKIEGLEQKADAEGCGQENEGISKDSLNANVNNDNQVDGDNDDNQDEEKSKKIETSLLKEILEAKPNKKCTRSET